MVRPSSSDPSRIPSPICRAVPLWSHTSVRAGGPARFFASPETVDQVLELLRWAERNGLATAVLGGGSNTIFTDDGFDGLVLDMTRLRGLWAEGRCLRALAGEPLSSVVDAACRLGYSGMVWAAGIPGTVAGAAAMNAGTRDGDMSAVVSRICVAAPEGLRWIEGKDLAYGYRTSAVKEGTVRGPIVEVELDLPLQAEAGCMERVAEIRRTRSQRLPRGATFGSVFRNPPDGPTAGELLDRAGCKKLRVGSVRVSNEHANILINEGRENASEILELIDWMKDRVRDAFGIDLQEEVVVIGAAAFEERLKGPGSRRLQLPGPGRVDVWFVPWQSGDAGDAPYRILEWYGAEDRALCVARRDSGQPFIEGWPDLNLSLSHSGRMAVLALGCGCGVGVDLERIRPIEQLPRLVRRFLAPDEARRIMQRPENERRAAFFRTWVRKEAYLKGLGGGVPSKLRSFTLNETDEGASIRSTSLEPDAVSRWHLIDLDPPDGYAAALAVDRDDAEIRVRDPREPDG